LRVCVPSSPPPAFTEPGTLSSILLKLMCSPSVPLYTYSAQLFYTICDEDRTLSAMLRQGRHVSADARVLA